MKMLFTLAISLAIGFVIWRIDSQPGWDDTAVTAGMILLSTGVISLVQPRRPYVCAFGVCVWIPLFAIIEHGNISMLAVFLFGLAGAYGGSLLRRIASVNQN